MNKTIVVLHGDQTGEELLQQALRVLDPGVIGVALTLQHFDLSLENRRATKNRVVEEAADAMVATGFGLKAATVTPEAQGDVGSPNLILRERVGATVIVRTGRRIPGVRPIGGAHGPVAVIRMAVGETSAPGNGAKAGGLMKSPTGRSVSPAGSAVTLPNIHSVTLRNSMRKSSAAPNIPSVQCTRVC